MVRFIFMCMVVVALAIMTTTAQFMLDGIQDAKQSVTARNDAVTENAQAQAVAAAPQAEQSSSPESLNAIETAAGNDDFGAGFSNQAPKGLEDEAPVAMPIPLNSISPSAE